MTDESKRDWGNFFSNTDFLSGAVGCSECGNLTISYFATKANEIIRKELEKSPVVYGVQAYEEWMSKETADNCGINYTHTAHLIRIEEIKRDPIKPPNRVTE